MNVSSVRNQSTVHASDFTPLKEVKTSGTRSSVSQIDFNQKNVLMLAFQLGALLGSEVTENIREQGKLIVAGKDKIALFRQASAAMLNIADMMNDPANKGKSLQEILTENANNPKYAAVYQWLSDNSPDFSTTTPPNYLQALTDAINATNSAGMSDSNTTPLITLADFVDNGKITGNAAIATKLSGTLSSEATSRTSASQADLQNLQASSQMLQQFTNISTSALETLKSLIQKIFQ